MKKGPAHHERSWSADDEVRVDRVLPSASIDIDGSFVPADTMNRNGNDSMVELVKDGPPDVKPNLIGGILGKDFKTQMKQAIEEK